MKQATSVLYDAPGPRARRFGLISSVLAGALILLALYFLVYRPLDARDQFSMDKWGPLIDPRNETFTLVWKRIGDGFRATLIAAAFAITASLVLGTGLAVLRLQLKALMRRRFTGLDRAAAYPLRALTWLLNAVTRFCVEVFRGMPVVITIFFVSQVLPELGLNLREALWFLVIGLTLYNMVVIGEILRSGMEGLPGGQIEAANAIGLTTFQTTRLVLLPQAFRVMLPALISQIVVVLKDTALGFIIGYEEALRVAAQIYQVLANPLQIYIVVGAIYILLNYSLSKLAEYVQRRLSRARRTATLPVGAPPPAAVGAEATIV